MSKFLGPIHYWVYNKILFQEEICRNFINFALNNKVAGFEDIDKKFPPVENKNLEDIIDVGNIHSWLADKMEAEEKRLAYIISLLIEEYYAEMLFISRKLGEEHKVDKDLSPKQVFDKMEEVFVNGMPCDGVNKVLKEDEKEIVWMLTKEIHGKYFEDYNIPVMIYYNIRMSVMQGMLEASSVKVEASDYEYRLYL